MHNSFINYSWLAYFWYHILNLVRVERFSCHHSTILILRTSDKLNFVEDSGLFCQFWFSFILLVEVAFYNWNWYPFLCFPCPFFSLGWGFGVVAYGKYKRFLCQFLNKGKHVLDPTEWCFPLWTLYSTTFYLESWIVVRFVIAYLLLNFLHCRNNPKMVCWMESYSVSILLRLEILILVDSTMILLGTLKNIIELEW